MIQENMPTLSICIPTYNRPETFERLLKELLPQLDNRVEIVVRDDSSNEASKTLFNQLINGTGIAFRYFRGEKIGLDAANLFLLEKAQGKFVWWFSDDDVLLKGGVQAVLELVEKNESLNFIWANFSFESIENIAVDKVDGPFYDKNDVLESLGKNIGLLSTYIVRTSEAQKGIPYAQKHVHGFSFASTAVVLWVIAQAGMLYFLRGPYILCHPTKIEEIKAITRDGQGIVKNEGFKTYGIYFYDVINGLSDKFSARAIRKILTINFAALWRGMLVGWVGGWDTPEGKRLTMLRLYWSFPECWIAIPLFCLPRSIVTLLYKIYKIFFSHRRFVFFKRFR
jgi:glycosyltransferase involved in cell wall biosynthesis